MSKTYHPRKVIDLDKARAKKVFDAKKARQEGQKLAKNWEIDTRLSA